MVYCKETLIFIFSAQENIKKLPSKIGYFSKLRKYFHTALTAQIAKDCKSFQKFGLSTISLCISAPHNRKKKLIDSCGPEIAVQKITDSQSYPVNKIDFDLRLAWGLISDCRRLPLVSQAASSFGWKNLKPRTFTLCMNVQRNFNLLLSNLSTNHQTDKKLQLLSCSVIG